MFENAGKKIKQVSIAIFWISVIACIILALIFGIFHKPFNAIAFFGFLVAGPLISYISTLLVVAFADLVDNTQRIREAAEDMLHGKPQAQGSSYSTLETSTNTASITGKWVCEKCGYANEATEKYCKSCKKYKYS